MRGWASWGGSDGGPGGRPRHLAVRALVSQAHEEPSSRAHQGPLPAQPHGSTVLAAMSDDDLKAELERLRAENERLKQKGTRATSLKASEQGRVPVSGLRRF